jgi:putative redox protein
MENHMSIKTVKVESCLDGKFKVESNIGGHAVVVDQPAEAGGTGAGPSPLEYLFVGLSGCVASVGRIVAMQKQIDLRGMNVAVEGDLNLDGLLGKATDDPIGFKEIRITVDIDADMSAAEKQAFADEIDARCPVSSSLLQATKVEITAA